ncbi:hypothetical protein PR202_ga30160 [Eleusine coracana subsp. coracana]|uniref:Transposase-associated domain-containing protein n=1 Tax=Eleusine coracana subsp. coracana TaxID=191504 RepID=A0AAV5DP69_ELECO|nr:hypothetical protein PR202_ga30160 [Eleusine coracana subsp. coracana]
MDKSWIDNDARYNTIFITTTKNNICSLHLIFAFRNSAIGNRILCPCRVCVNSFWRDASEVREHLICDESLKGCRTWTLHGEASSSCVNHGSGDIREVIE